eukprot:6180991-Pleurochrysis_carterae.AAC.2
MKKETNKKRRQRKKEANRDQTSEKQAFIKGERKAVVNRERREQLSERQEQASHVEDGRNRPHQLGQHHAVEVRTRHSVSYASPRCRGDGSSEYVVRRFEEQLKPGKRVHLRCSRVERRQCGMLWAQRNAAS